MKINLSVLFLAVVSNSSFANTSAPDLDIQIRYYSKVVTAEGVTREARYEEKMLRRPGHVWVERVLPENREHAEHQASESGAQNKDKHVGEHKHFNHVVTPRHVSLAHNQVSVEYIDAKNKQRIAIPPAEYSNVNFDGSWENSFYLIDPKWIKTMPRTNRASPIAGAVWHESEKNGIFDRVLWSEQKQIPLLIESGDKNGSVLRRVEIKPMNTLSSNLPWLSLKSFAQKEYSDFLD